MDDEYELARQELAAELAETVRRNVALSSRWYTDPKILELERRLVFRRTWQYVGRLSRVPSPGDFFVCEIAKVPILVIRENADKINAFVNVCRHRCHPVIGEECGSAKRLQCPYHGWVYDLNGSLRAAPRLDRENRGENLDKTELSLVPVQLETWGPLIFLNLDRQAKPLRDVIGRLPDVYRKRGIDPAEFVLHERQTYTLRCNWKLLVDNSLECYHCGVAHPSWNKAFYPTAENYRLEILGESSYQYGSPREVGSRGNTPPSIWGERELTELGIAYIWPTTVILEHEFVYWIWSYMPLDLENTLFVAELYFLPDVSRKEKQKFIDFYDPTLAEDKVILEAVQRSHGSGMIPPGPLLKGSERLVSHAIGLLSDAFDQPIEEEKAA